MESKEIVLASRPKGKPSEESFRTESITLPDLKEDQLLAKGLYYSVDPYMRGRMNDTKSYAKPYQVDEPIKGGVVAEVIESKSADFEKGDVVTGLLPWATKCVVAAKQVRKVDTNLAPASYYLGILGMPGLTAYFGMVDIGKPKAGETVVISGAAGAVGIVACQIGKLKGCRVVGIAGTDEKIEMLKSEFGIDDGISYKTTKNMQQAVKEACPEGVDIYYDNVGGEISDAVIENINFHARIVLCGQISLYNATETPIGPRIQPMLLTRSVLMQGFIVGNYEERFPEAVSQLARWVKEGKLTYEETIVEGFEKLPKAFLGLFSGKNTGKMIVKA